MKNTGAGRERLRALLISMTVRKTSRTGKGRCLAVKVPIAGEDVESTPAAEQGPVDPPNPSEVRQRLVDKILTEAYEIVVALIGQAKSGNHIPAKYLFEFARIAEPSAESGANAEARSRARSLAEILVQTVQSGPREGEPSTHEAALT